MEDYPKFFSAGHIAGLKDGTLSLQEALAQQLVNSKNALSSIEEMKQAGVSVSDEQLKLLQQKVIDIQAAIKK